MTQFVIVVAETLHATAIADAITAPFKTVAKLTISLVEYIRKENLINSTIKELNCLSDRELADIGISRGMIRSVATETYK